MDWKIDLACLDSLGHDERVTPEALAILVAVARAARALSSSPNPGATLLALSDLDAALLHVTDTKPQA